MRIIPQTNDLQPAWASSLRDLHTEPDTGIARIRTAWPDIQRALFSGHRLKVIHLRLCNAGLQIPYSTLARYVHQLRAELARRPHHATNLPAMPVSQPQTRPHLSAGDYDPLAGAIAALNKPRYDIRQAMSDGDPTGKKLI